MMGKFFLLPFALLTAQLLVAQTHNLGSWNIFNLKYNIDEKWSVFGEGQLRSLKFYDHFHYYEYKGGVSLEVMDQLRVAIGVGSYQTYREGGDFVLPKNNNELRIWPQVTLTQPAGRFRIEQRYRAEARITSNGYRNRFRYRLGLSYPFGMEKNGVRSFLFFVNNELFFTNTEPYFERNRLQGGLNYRLSTSSTIQIGYLHQFDYKINDETGRDFLVLGYYFELN